MKLVLARDSPLLARRRELCGFCPFLVKAGFFLGKFMPPRCAKCGCFIKPKTRLVGESCPVGRW